MAYSIYSCQDYYYDKKDLPTYFVPSIYFAHPSTSAVSSNPAEFEWFFYFPLPATGVFEAWVSHLWVSVADPSRTTWCR